MRQDEFGRSCGTQEGTLKGSGKMAMIVVAPLIVQSPTLVESPIVPPMVPTSMEEDIASVVAQAPSSLSGDGGKLRAVLIEIENILILPDEAFMVEATVLLKRAVEKPRTLRIYRRGCQT